MKIAIILGTRPEIIKMSPIIRTCIDQNINYFVIHSHQHYSDNMDQIFFNELELPQPKYNLKTHASLHGDMTAQILTNVEKILINEKPDWILVQGDTNTVLAGALAASKLGINIGHIEAGLRSYDRNMPEEINRILTDHLSQALFCPTQKQSDILIGEGIDQKKIFITGNTIVDVIIQNQELLKKHPEFNHYQDEKYFFLTTHRPTNVDNQENLQKIINILTEISKQYNYPIYFPIHPRTQKQLSEFNIKLDSQIFKIMPPVGYLEILSLEKNAQLIFTDSGGIQEEACILHVPCITLRDNTERPETVEVGANIVTGLNSSTIQSAVIKMLKPPYLWKNPFGDGNSAKKILLGISTKNKN